MPLYTYVIAYGGSSYVAQARRSNFKGFASIWTDLPPNALPALEKEEKQRLAERAYREPFDEVPNRKGVWKQTINLDEGPFVVYAIQTDA